MTYVQRMRALSVSAGQDGPPGVVLRTTEQVGAAYRVEAPSAKILDQLRTPGLVEAFGPDDPAAGG